MMETTDIEAVTHTLKGPGDHAVTSNNLIITTSSRVYSGLRNHTPRTVIRRFLVMGHELAEGEELPSR